MKSFPHSANRHRPKSFDRGEGDGPLSHGLVSKKCGSGRDDGNRIPTNHRRSIGNSNAVVARR
jgi:hypothetical protein